LPGAPPPKLYGPHDADFDGAAAEPAVVGAAYADLAREQAATDAVLADYPDLSVRVGKDAIAVRELLVHRIEEYARHCGHADLCGSALTAGLASDASSPAVPARVRHVSAKRQGAERGSHLRADRNREPCHFAPHYPTLDAIGPLSEVRAAAAAEPDQVLRLPSSACPTRCQQLRAARCWS
jgi:hypothetical protein